MTEKNTNNINTYTKADISKKKTQTTTKTTKKSNNTQYVYVSTDGSDSNSGTKNSPKKTIQNALSTVSKGGTIYLSNGTYKQSEISINNDVTILGENTKNTIIDCEKKQAFNTEGTITFKGFTIENAYSTTNGAAINNNGTLKIEGLKIKTSYSNNLGGAVYNTGNLKISKTAFSSNNAKNGGAIFNTNNLTIKYTTFSSNKAKQSGSAIFSNGTLNINSCNFTNNYNTSVYINQNDYDNIIQSSRFIKNEGTNGGAIYNRKASLTIDKTLFENNNATNEGGAIYTSGKINSTENTFNRNNADIGGAISSHLNIMIDQNSVKSNTATSQGGFLYNVGKATITQTKLNNNSAKYGGAISSQTNKTQTLLLLNDTFTNNNASVGGAIYAIGKTKLTIKQSIFGSNTGSAIYINNIEVTNTISNSTFTKNVASKGGAINNQASDLSISKAVFSDNNAKNGGAIYNNNGKVTVKNSILLNNKVDVYNKKGKLTANYNWWGKNDKPSSRQYNSTISNWIYMKLINDNPSKVKKNSTNIISLNYLYDGKTVTKRENNKYIPILKMNIVIKGPGVNTNKTVYKRGYYESKCVYTKAGISNVTATVSNQKIKNKISVKGSDRITSLFIRLDSSVTKNTVDTWKNVGITDVYVQSRASTNDVKQLKNVIELTKNTNIRVHAWIICFITDHGFDLSSKQQTMIKNFIYKTIRINGVKGICLDYVRYDGTKPSIVKPSKITSFVKSVNNIIKSYNSNSILSAAVFAEMAGTKTYYGQDYAALSPYVDVMMPMAYKYDYTPTSAWLAKVTAYVVKKAKYSKVVTVLQTYKGSSTTLLPKSELEQDAQTVINAGSDGYSLFRYGLISSYPKNANAY